MRGPAHRQNFFAVRGRAEVAEHRTVTGPANSFFHATLPSDTDRFALDGKFFPALSGCIIIRFDGMYFFPVDFDVVANGGGDAPGDHSIMTELESGSSGNRRTPDVKRLGVDACRFSAQMH